MIVKFYYYYKSDGQKKLRTLGTYVSQAVHLDDDTNDQIVECNKCDE